MREAGEREEDTHIGREESVQRLYEKHGSSERSGFTAVNGDKNNHSTFRPDGNSEQEAQRASNHNLALERPDHKAHALKGWRSSDRNDSVLNAELASGRSPEGTKRKRSEDELQEGARREHSTTAGRDSPKRRLLDQNLDACAQRPETSPPEGSDEGYICAGRVRVDEGRPSVAKEMSISINPSGRERSPVRAWNQRDLPPQVRPETEADLAQSLASHLHSVKNSSPTAESPPPGAMAYGDHRSQEYSPDASGGNQQNKKKRNFSNRTKTGCHTCRDRKKKCDEAKPICNNCARGNFPCGGYGPKPPGFRSNGARSSVPVPLQSKQYDAIPGPTGHYNMEGARYDHWGRVPPPPPPAPEPYSRYGSDHTTEDSRYPRGRDSWPRVPWDSSQPFHLSHTLPPVDYPPPPLSYANEPPPPPPPIDPWSHTLPPPIPSQPGAATTISSHESVGTSSSQRAPRLNPLNFPIPGQMSEKEKMLLGRPYLHNIDDVLIDDRNQCKAAIERYNNAARPSEAISSEERMRFFSAVIDPARRPNPNPSYRDTPANTPTMTRPGRVGYRTIVEAPFNCDYGYNVLIGDDVVVGAGCYMQDPCEIIIGNRTIIGPNVRFYGQTASVDAASRKGSQGLLSGGAITVEEDVFIGGDVTILPHRTIGKGAVVGASSVVTRNVPAYTVVAGNPAREIRTLGPGPVEDRRMRTAIQSENDQSMRDMRVRRGYRE